MAIQILAKKTAEQIAAGEVIENPASVVKELLENALDAGAGKIEVELEKGGKSLIRVSDNGSGIDKEDLPLAFQRFATSKIANFDDLYNLSSLGFRGEALPSIAAVSRIQLTTRTDQSFSGTIISLNGGEIIDQEETGAPVGTRVEVKDLFYNTPGRLKFLRADHVETTRISTLISEMALARPKVAFTLKSGGRTLFSSSGDGMLPHVLGSLYGNDIAEAMVEVKRKDISNGCMINGFISPPHITRSTRKWITLVVNGRLIKDALVINALERGYEDLLAGRRHPLAIIILSVPPEVIDVNVHPAKIEVRFQKPDVIKGLTFKAVKIALQGAYKHSFWPEQGKSSSGDGRAPLGDDQARNRKQWQPGQLFSQPSINHAGTNMASHQKESSTLPADEFTHSELTGSADRINEEPVKASYNDELRLIGQFMQSYLVAQKGDQLLIIDQHAAHERINYHQLKNQSAVSAEASQAQLTIPLKLDLPPAWCERLPILMPLLEQSGFILEPDGTNSYLVKAVPFTFRKSVSKAAIYDLLEDLIKTENEPDQDPRDAILTTLACHRSIKARQSLSRNEMEQLLVEWAKIPSSGYCPHGRPAVISLDRRTLDKSFHRSSEGGEEV